MVSLAAGAVAVAAADLVLAFACYRTRTVLGGLASFGSAVLVGISAGQLSRGGVAMAEMPATLVADRDRIVEWVDVDADYGPRPEPEQIPAALDDLARA